ncbi:MAG: class I SAM-dependent methyltransferase [Acidimicrobiia bacterium]
MQEERLDTAHQAWDRRWADPTTRASWNQPEPAVTELVPALVARGVRRVVDVGTGIGRHALVFARASFEVVAIDASPTGLAELRREADAQGLRIDTRLAPFTSLPIDDDSIDHVLAWNVLYHGDADVVRTAFSECRRVLHPGGTTQLTMLSKRHRAFGAGREVRPDTFVDDQSAGDKSHPHFYVDATTLTAMLTDAHLEALSVVDIDQQPPGSFHWTVLAEAAVRER